MSINFKFWVYIALTVLFFFLGFSIVTTGIFHFVSITLGTLSLIVAVYLLGKIKVLELWDILKYLIYRIKGNG